jgi:hypothetical protein
MNCTDVFLQVLPEVEASLKEWGTESVVIFGIEVGPLPTPLSAITDDLYDNRVTSVSSKPRLTSWRGTLASISSSTECRLATTKRLESLLP